MSGQDYWVEVCSSCLTALCWHGELMCQHGAMSGIIRKKASELLKLRRENPDNFSQEKLMAVCGEIELVIGRDDEEDY